MSDCGKTNTPEVLFGLYFFSALYDEAAVYVKTVIGGECPAFSLYGGSTTLLLHACAFNGCTSSGMNNNGWLYAVASPHSPKDTSKGLDNSNRSLRKEAREFESFSVEDGPSTTIVEVQPTLHGGTS